MVADFPTAAVVVLALGLGLAFTCFGYSFVTRLTSLVGGLAGALLGSFVAQTLVAPAVGVASPDLLLVSLVGALVGSIAGSRVAYSAQRPAIVALCVLLSSSVVYSLLASPDRPGAIPVSALGSISPVVESALVGGAVGILVWQFYLPFLTVVTSLFGASVLQHLAIHWSSFLPILRSDVWETLGTSYALWLLIVGFGIAVQYRRYRRRRSRGRR
ncbi:hypothetical protein [Haladaptatus salinisoli]|uniref:hypothetical protein n=1 Tax=Haladaptatus salinisoli TaxID=2884876 RepID=UPI001D0A5150|nr:hypothetical protein [Haladaptatus salinisoli]